MVSLSDIARVATGGSKDQKDQKVSEPTSQKANDFHLHLLEVLEKLQNDASTITPDDGRRLHEHLDATDEHSAKIVSAIEALAAAHTDISKEKGDLKAMANDGHASLHTLVVDLQAAVDKNPGDVTAEILKLAQNAVSKMQKAVGNSTAAHPELEAELQDEYARIERKVEQGIVTKQEADHLHSLEARAHGHTEKGGLTAHAQSVAARRERQASVSEGSNGNPTSTANSASNNQHLGPKEQSHMDKENNLHKVELVIREKIEKDPEHITKEDATLLESRDRRAPAQ